MAWIQLHQSVFTHWKTYRLADLLDVTRDRAVLMMTLLWTWAIDNSNDGEISLLSARALGDVMHWPGDPRRLADALVESRFVDRTDGRLSIHDWHDYGGKLADFRRRDRERKRAARERARIRRQKGAQSEDQPARPDTSGEGSPDGSGTSPTRPMDVRRTSTRRVEKSREDKSRQDESRVEETVAGVVTEEKDCQTVLASLGADADAAAILQVFPEIHDPDELRMVAEVAGTYPHVDHGWEARKCRARHKRAPNWAVVYSNWVAGGLGVRYKDGTQGPPALAPPQPEEESPHWTSNFTAFQMAMHLIDSGETPQEYIERRLESEWDDREVYAARLAALIPEAEEKVRQHLSRESGSDAAISLTPDGGSP